MFMRETVYGGVMQPLLCSMSIATEISCEQWPLFKGITSIIDVSHGIKNTSNVNPKKWQTCVCNPH